MYHEINFTVSLTSMFMCVDFSFSFCFGWVFFFFPAVFCLFYCHYYFLINDFISSLHIKTTHYHSHRALKTYIK